MHIGKVKKPQYLVKNFNTTEERIHNKISSSWHGILKEFFEGSNSNRRLVKGAINKYLIGATRQSTWVKIGCTGQQQDFRTFMECNEIDEYTKALYLMRNTSRFHDFLNDHLYLADKIYDILAYWKPDFYFVEIIKRQDIKALKHMYDNFYGDLWTNNNMRKLAGTKDANFIKQVAALDYKRFGEFLVFFTRRRQRDGTILEIVSEEIILEVLKQNGSALKSIHPDNRTPAMFKTAIQTNGLMIALVPVKERTQELCSIAMERSATAVKYVPKKFQNKGAIMKLVLNGKKPLKYVKQ